MEVRRMEVSTITGGSERRFENGPPGVARFSSPCGVAVDSAGILYVADSSNNRIRKILPDGIASTVAGGVKGYADGVGAAAQFNDPIGIAVDSAGNLYVADTDNHRIRKILPDGTVSTLAGGVKGRTDGVGTDARFDTPYGVAVDSAGVLYVADSENSQIRKILPDGTVSTLAGSGEDGYAGGEDFANGPGDTARFYAPYGIAVDSAGVVYVADTNNNRIRKIFPDGTVSTLAGSKRDGFVDGVGGAAQFNLPFGIVVDGTGVIYVADMYNNRIRKILPDGTVSTLAGSGEGGFADGVGKRAEFNEPRGIAIDSAGNLYVADTENNRIRKLVPAPGANEEDAGVPNLPPAHAAPNVNRAPSVHRIPYENRVSSASSNLSVLPATYRDVVNMEDVAPGTADYTFFVVGKNGFALDGGSLTHYTNDNEFKLYKCREGTRLTSLYIRESDVHMTSPIRILQFEFPIHVVDQQAQLIQPGHTYRLTPTADVLGQVASHATIRGESVVSGNHCQEMKTDRMYKIEEILVGGPHASMGAVGGRRAKQTKRRNSKSRVSNKRRKGSRSTRKRRGTRRQ